jgi:RNA 2',3'-cyclic 3'-phosphodiesterase
VRLFVALEIPAAVRDNLSAFLRELRELSARVADKRPRWVRPENLHLTLKFIGEADAAKLESIRAALAMVRSNAPVELRFRGLGFFPNEKHARVFWVGLNPSPNLAALAGDIDVALATLGIARENRPFVPHLTLARFQPPGLHEKLRAAIQSAAMREFGSFQTSELHLIESNTKPSGAEHTHVASFSFVTEA